MQQSDSLCLAVNPPPFDKGGKCGGAGRGDGGKAIPPVVARIFSGDSTSPLTREASVVVRGDGCAFEKVVGMERLVGDPSVLRQIGLIEY